MSEMIEKELDEVYHERNLLACAVVAGHLDHGGWTPAPDADSEEWAIAWTETPMGLLSWHVPREMAEKYLPRDDRYEYDGHSTPVKNYRLQSWLDSGLTHYNEERESVFVCQFCGAKHETVEGHEDHIESVHYSQVMQGATE